MPRSFKFKTAGIVTGDEIPIDVEELKLDCKVIGEYAFTHHRDLVSVTLINTEVIRKEAFDGCRLKNIRLPDTLREIGDWAFADADISHLIIPPNVVKLGSNVITDEIFYQTMTIYLKDEKTAPFFDGSLHYVYKPLWLVVRSLRTRKILYRFLVFNYLEETLTEHGVDFTKHDELMMIEDNNGYNYCAEAARARLKHPVNMSAEAIEKLKDRVSGITFDRLKSMMSYYGFDENYPLKEFKKYAVCNFIRLKAVMELMQNNDENISPGIIEILTQLFHKKLNENLSADELAQAAKYSAKLGLIEITAILMQKLHEKGHTGKAALEL